MNNVNQIDDGVYLVMVDGELAATVSAELDKNGGAFMQLHPVVPELLLVAGDVWKEYIREHLERLDSEGGMKAVSAYFMEQQAAAEKRAVH